MTQRHPAPKYQSPLKACLTRFVTGFAKVFEVGANLAVVVELLKDLLM